MKIRSGQQILFSVSGNDDGTKNEKKNGKWNENFFNPDNHRLPTFTLFNLFLERGKCKHLPYLFIFAVKLRIDELKKAQIIYWLYIFKSELSSLRHPIGIVWSFTIPSTVTIRLSSANIYIRLEAISYLQVQKIDRSVTGKMNIILKVVVLWSERNSLSNDGRYLHSLLSEGRVFFRIENFCLYHRLN